MIFIDASAYLAILKPGDSNKEKALQIAETIFEKAELITSQAILGEVLTIGSQKHNRQAAIAFVKDILKSTTKIVTENKMLVERAFALFEEIPDKDVSWVDCYSFAIIETHKIEKVFSFDKDFRKYSKAEVLI